MNQADAAELLETTQSYVSKVEAGQRRIDLVQLGEFARIYGKDLGYFIRPVRDTRKAERP